MDTPCRFLLSARKRKKSKSANYIISTDANDTARHSPHFAGKVRSNFLGTEFVLYDAGDKPGKRKGGEHDASAELLLDCNVSGGQAQRCACQSPENRPWQARRTRACC